MGCSERGQSLVARHQRLAPGWVAILTDAHVYREWAPPASWHDVVAEAGYADQSHLTREVHALAGLTPARLIHERTDPGSA